ncbi:hypothetical protein DFH07DRAFT_532303 [Mycena maculata]|uniref:Secreted protein n=1 Tax=Mycena maculata TaxID=230809 RepID=A0AAD7N9C3_9AGAR|nr:hypothetical protein DFH07DRAFT_532303 [Mycena maculata]
MRWTSCAWQVTLLFYLNASSCSLGFGEVGYILNHTAVGRKEHEGKCITCMNPTNHCPPHPRCVRSSRPISLANCSPTPRARARCSGSLIRAPAVHGPISGKQRKMLGKCVGSASISPASPPPCVSSSERLPNPTPPNRLLLRNVFAALKLF